MINQQYLRILKKKLTYDDYNIYLLSTLVTYKSTSITQLG